MPKRTELSQSRDPSKSWKAYISKNKDKLQKTPKEDPRKTPFARETMHKEVLVLAQNVLT
jgi:hypothetical protein